LGRRCHWLVLLFLKKNRTIKNGKIEKEIMGKEKKFLFLKNRKRNETVGFNWGAAELTTSH
jgi:hypothetical protein